MGPVGRRFGAVLRHRARRRGRGPGPGRRARAPAEDRALPHPSLGESRRGEPRGGRARRREILRSRRGCRRARPAGRLRDDPRQPPRDPQRRADPEPRAPIRRPPRPAERPAARHDRGGARLRRGDARRGPDPCEGLPRGGGGCVRRPRRAAHPERAGRGAGRARDDRRSDLPDHLDPSPPPLRHGSPSPPGRGGCRSGCSSSEAAARTPPCSPSPSGSTAACERGAAHSSRRPRRRSDRPRRARGRASADRHRLPRRLGRRGARLGGETLHPAGPAPGSRDAGEGLADPAAVAPQHDEDGGRRVPARGLRRARHRDPVRALALAGGEPVSLRPSWSR